MACIGIVGASGALGRVICRSLVDANPRYTIRALVRAPDSAIASLPRCELDTRGLFDAQALRELFDACDVVINLAAQNPDATLATQEFFNRCQQVNSLGGALVGFAAERQRTPLIHFSSVAVYEVGEYQPGEPLTELEQLPVGDSVLSDYVPSAVEALVSIVRSGDGVADNWRTFCDSNALPLTTPIYGLTKLLGELAVRQFAMPSVSLRLCDVYGPGHESRGVIVEHLRALQAKNEVQVDLDFRQTACFFYIEDVAALARGLIDRLLAQEEMPDVLNVAGTCINETDLATKLKTLGAESDHVWKLSVAADAVTKKDRRYATERFEAALGGIQLTEFSKGLSKTWAQLRSELGITRQ